MNECKPLELGSTLYHDHRVRQMFMLFELLPKFVRQDEQETARVAKASHMVGRCRLTL